MWTFRFPKGIHFFKIPGHEYLNLLVHIMLLGPRGLWKRVLGKSVLTDALAYRLMKGE